MSHRVEKKKGNFMVVNTIKPVICTLNKILSRIGILSKFHLLMIRFDGR